MKTAVLAGVLFFGAGSVFGQIDWLSYPAKTSDSTRIMKTEGAELNYNGSKGQVVVHKDARIDKLAEFVRSGEESLEGVKINGYRIVIYFDQSKSSVEQQKAQFLSRYPDHRAYIDYLAPNYRVRVGNFRTRLEAESLKSELLNTFPTAVVVEDKIQLPELPGEGVEENR